MNDIARFPMYLRLPGMADAGEVKKEGDAEGTAGGKTFGEDYVKELREENKKRREENVSLKKAHDEALSQIKVLGEKAGQVDAVMEKFKSFSELFGDKKDKDADPVKLALGRMEKLENENKALREEGLKHTVYAAFIAEAQKAGMSPERIDDAYKLADLSVVKVDPETRKVEGVTEIVAALKEKKSYLFVAPTTDMGADGHPAKKKEGTYPDSTVQLAATLKLSPEFLHKKIEEKAKKDSISYDDAMRKYWGVNPKGSLIARVFGGS